MLKKRIFILYLLFFVLSAKAQNAPMLNFTNFEKKDGLLNTMVRQITQDDKGTVFFATQGGVFFYNGYKIKPFLTYTKYDKKALALGQPTGFLQGNDEHYWVATDFMGLYEYDPILSKVTTHLTPNKDIVLTLYKDSKGIIWVGTKNGLAYIKNENGLNKLIFSSKNEEITAIAASNYDDERIVWATKNQKIKVLNNKNEVTREIAVPEGEVKTVAFAKNNTMWVGTTKGLFNNDTKNGDLGDFLSKMKLNNPIIEKYGVNSMLFDSKNRLWLGTYGGGLLLWDSDKKEFYSYQHDKNNSKSLLSNHVISLFEDKTGQIWVGTAKGASVFNGNINLFSPVTDNGTLHKAANPLNKDLLKMLPDSLQKKHTKNVMLTFTDKNGGLWWSESDGCNFHFYDKNKKIYKAYQQPLHIEGNNSGCVNAMLHDRRGHIWVAAYNGTYLYDAKKDTFLNIHTIFKNVVSGNSNAGNALTEDADGNIWNGRYEGGLDVFNLDKKYYQHFDLEDGLPDKSINSMQVDAQNNLWLVTPNGLCFVELKKELFEAKNDSSFLFFKVYNTDDGLPSNALSNSILQTDKSGKPYLYVDSEEGMTRIDPQAVEFNKQVPRVSFSALRVLNKTVVPDSSGFSILKKPIEFAKSIVLKHDENSFAFDFTANNPQHSALNTYWYRLEGYETTWQKLVGSNTVAYTQVPPGVYTLLVKAANNDGLLNRAATSIVITIAPAFWQTWWFKLGALSVLLGLIYWFYRNRLRNARLEAELKQAEAEAKQRETAHQKQLAITEMSALRAQMNPHFIFNCLNSIHNFTLDNDSDNASKYLTKFAKLIRLVLENSRSERVRLADEINALTLYIEMEALRFKEKVRYEINIDEDLEVDMLQIPPMLIQPYIENSIWHGLMPKKKGGIVLVNLIAVNEDILRIEIIDDGVGRARAKALKSKNATEHKSHGMQITSDRVAIIKELYNIETTIAIIDLFDTENEPKGTKVVIEIPI